MNDSNSCNIFILSYCFPNYENPQLGRFVLDQCEELYRRGINIVVLNVASTRKLSKSPISEREINGIKVIELQHFAFALFKLARLTTKMFYHKYDKIYNYTIKKYGIPNKLYAHFCFPTGFVAAKLSKCYHIPFVVMEHHSIFFRDKLPHFIRIQTKNAIMKSDAFICVSEALKVAITNHTGCPKGKLLVINNIIDKSFLYVGPQIKESFCFFSAGNLVKVKRFDLLISAAAILVNKGHDFCIRIAGQGSEYDILKKQVEKLHLINHIQFLGRLSKHEMLTEYSFCDAFILVSRKETYGVAYREALLVGRPVISSDNGGIHEGWDDAFGIIVKDITPGNLAEAMESMIVGYKSYDLKKIADTANTKFSADSVCSKLIPYLV